MTIAVLIPAYNVAPYLSDCLDSVLAQTYTDFEVHIMNDGSTDETQAILEAYATKDKRIHIYHQENQGLTKTRNTLLLKVSPQAEFLCHVDADDFIHPRAFERLMSCITKNQADVVECAILPVSFNVHPRMYQDLLLTEEEECIEDMSIFWCNRTRKGRWINNQNKLYRKESVQNLTFSEKLSFEEDYFYQCQVNAQIHKKVLIPDTLYFYRHNPSSMTKSVNFEKYLTCAINRIQLSYETFLKTNRVPTKYLADFKNDLAHDAYRMIIRKNLKKNKTPKQCRLLFQQASQAITRFQSEKIVDFQSLSFPKKMALWSCRHRLFLLTKILVYIAG